jgi:hypothetical protein
MLARSLVVGFSPNHTTCLFYSFFCVRQYAEKNGEASSAVSNFLARIPFIVSVGALYLGTCVLLFITCAPVECVHTAERVYSFSIAFQEEKKKKHEFVCTVLP